MQKNRYFPLTLIAIAVLSGCSSVPQNSSLNEAHASYNSAQNNPQVTRLASAELQVAGDSLNKADAASSKGESDATVEQLAYVAKQQVGVAQETAYRRASEAEVNNATAKRNEVRLAARTAEADAAKQELAVMEQTVEQQAIALAEASTNADRDQALIAQQDMQLRELSATRTQRGLVMTLGDVLFNTDMAQLESGGMRKMQQLADFLNQYPHYRVLIEGYTDNTGSNEHNQELSENRANAVRVALLDMGISDDRIALRGYGEAFPIASNGTAENRQLNRRVEIILSDRNGNVAAR